MIVLGYVGPPKGGRLFDSVTWSLIRAVQVGYVYRQVTHAEMLLDGPWHAATIASSSLMDGGVRIKTGVRLTPDHWRAWDVPGWHEADSLAWFVRHLGEPYDRRGAVGSVLFGLGNRPGEWFCNEACGTSVGLRDQHRQPPAGFAAQVVSQPGAQEVTVSFFNTNNTNP